MGTDIHAFVELDSSDREPFSGTAGIHSVAVGDLWLERDYEIFDALAWGRSWDLAPEHRSPPPLVAPRGIPRALSLPVTWAYYAIVATDGTPDGRFWPVDAVVSADEAAAWEKRGSVRSAVEQTGHFGRTPPQLWALVSKPWWHTASWLRPSELDESLARLRYRRRLPFGYKLLQTIVDACVDEFGAERVRVVVWFDN